MIDYDSEAALLRPRVFSAASVFEAELDRLFARCWLAIGHEGQLPRPGDFLVSRMAVDPVLVWRGLDGELRVFLNYCPISGSRLCLAEGGNGSGIVCRCHGLLFGSDGLVAGGGEQLVRVDRVESFSGLIFATHEAEETGLADYLGDFAHYLETLLAGREVRASALKGTIEANWKLPMDAFMGGMAVENASRAIQPEALDDLVQVSAGPGGLAGRWGEQGTFEPVRGALFPNLALSWVEDGLHILMPRGPRETEVWSLWLTGAELEPAEQQRSRFAFQREFAVSAPAFEDMASHWEQITRLSTSFAVRQQQVRLEAGLGKERYHEDLPGMVADADSEMNQRAFYQRWQSMLAR